MTPKEIREIFLKKYTDEDIKNIFKGYNITNIGGFKGTLIGHISALNKTISSFIENKEKYPGLFIRIYRSRLSVGQKMYIFGILDELLSSDDGNDKNKICFESIKNNLQLKSMIY